MQQRLRNLQNTKNEKIKNIFGLRDLIKGLLSRKILIANDRTHKDAFTQYIHQKDHAYCDALSYELCTCIVHVLVTNSLVRNWTHISCTRQKVQNTKADETRKLNQNSIVLSQGFQLVGPYHTVLLGALSFTRIPYPEKSLYPVLIFVLLQYGTLCTP